MFKGKIIDPDLWNKQQRLFLLVMITNGILMGSFTDESIYLFALIFLPLFVLLAVYIFQKKVLKRKVDLGVIKISNEGILLSFPDKTESYIPKSEVSCLDFKHIDMLCSKSIKEGLKAFLGYQVFPAVKFVHRNIPYQYSLMVDSEIMTNRLLQIKEKWGI